MMFSGTQGLVVLGIVLAVVGAAMNLKHWVLSRARSSSAMAVVTAAWLVLGLWALSGPRLQAENWPGWRGDGNGLSGETNLPVHWDATHNVAWKTPLPGKGNSSPVIWQKKLFLTAFEDEGRKRLVLCVNADDGRIVWQRAVAADTVGQSDPKNGYASSTCVTDGERLYAFFDSPGLLAFDLDGRLLWQKALGPFTALWGLASSPVLYQDSVIIVCDHEKGAFVAALAKTTGKELWRTPRENRLQFATPILFRHAGQDQMVVNGATVAAYNPATGQLLWTCRGMRNGCTPTALYHDGLVWVTSGRNGPVLAIDPAGRGEISDSHLRMHLNSGGCYIPSPLAPSRLVMLPGDEGHIRFVGASGQVTAQTRLAGHFSSSPILAGSRIYWSNEKGVTYVLDTARLHPASPAVDLVATNDLGESILASPAVAGRRLFLRTASSLFCLAGDQQTMPTVSASTQPVDLAALRARFNSHTNQHGPDVQIRLEVVEAASRINDPEVSAFLLQAVRDPQWDASTAAAHALGRLKPPAIDALDELLREAPGQEYLNVIAADCLGGLQAVKAVPRLLNLASRAQDSMVRLAALRASAKIALAPEADPNTILPALVRGLADQEGTVIAATIEALIPLESKTGRHRLAVVQALKTCVRNPNRLVSAAAHNALAAAYKD